MTGTHNANKKKVHTMIFYSRKSLGTQFPDISTSTDTLILTLLLTPDIPTSTTDMLILTPRMEPSDAGITIRHQITALKIKKLTCVFLTSIPINLSYGITIIKQWGKNL